MIPQSVTKAGEIRGVDSLSHSYSAPASQSCPHCGARPLFEDEGELACFCGWREQPTAQRRAELMAEVNNRTSHSRDPQPGAWRAKWRDEPAQLALWK